MLACKGACMTDQATEQSGYLNRNSRNYDNSDFRWDTRTEKKKSGTTAENRRCPIFAEKIGESV
jgi:hypothetical protein